MKPPVTRYLVVRAPQPFRYPDGRSSGCCVGYLEERAGLAAALTRQGYEVLGVTEELAVAQAWVRRYCEPGAPESPGRAVCGTGTT
jgi:hypothetical protein